MEIENVPGENARECGVVIHVMGLESRRSEILVVRWLIGHCAAGRSCYWQCWTICTGRVNTGEHHPIRTRPARRREARVSRASIWVTRGPMGGLVSFEERGGRCEVETYLSDFPRTPP